MTDEFRLRHALQNIAKLIYSLNGRSVNVQEFHDVIIRIDQILYGEDEIIFPRRKENTRNDERTAEKD